MNTLFDRQSAQIISRSVLTGRIRTEKSYGVMNGHRLIGANTLGRETKKPSLAHDNRSQLDSLGLQCFECSELLSFYASFFVLALEFLNATSCVNNFMLTRKEWM